MEDFDDLSELDPQALSAEVLENFCDVYLNDAVRVIGTGFVAPIDSEMCRVALSIVIAMYYKNLNEGIISNRVLH